MNVILLITDTFREDNIYGEGSEMPVRTPNLDEFSRRAVSFRRFYTGSFPTIPHRSDLATGRLGWLWFGWRPLPEPAKDNRIVSLLQQAGFVSQLICDCPHLFPAQFNRAFNGAIQLRGQEGDTYFTRYNYPIEEVIPRSKTRINPQAPGTPTLVDRHRWQHRFWRLEQDTFPPRTAGLAVEWLEENYRHHPFFLWVDFFDPHEPWDPPEYMVKRYDPDYDGIPMLHPNYGPSSIYTEEELRNLRAHYCAEAELVDRWLGRILQKIDDLSLWENSIVIVTTDHGMSIGEHQRTGKSNIHPDDERFWPTYPEIAHIPFLISAPNIDVGREVYALCQPVDILPTILDLTSAEVEVDPPFHGSSLAPILRGERKESEREFAVCGSCSWGKEGQFRQRSVTPVLYTDRWAYAPCGAYGKAELYNISSDPYAENNVVADNRSVAESLHQKLLQWLKEIEAPEYAFKALEKFRD